jgi:cellulose synthase/poly-beta-1,6-N-acetylglucosamine synthase-like glycosyltransferase
MRLLKSFNPLRFFILIIVIGGLTFFSFLTAFGKDEGTLGNNFFLNFMADTFYIFRFPTHVLFWKYMNGGTFFLGLLINILFYAVVMEVVIISLKNHKKDQILVH